MQLLTLIVGCGPVAAADIRTATISGLTFISVSGELLPGDDDKFSQLANATAQATVLLDGPGGLSDVGISIGRTIRQRGYSTAVGTDSVCASACGLIWLAGSERFMRPTSLIGFHAIYRAPDGTPQVSSDGNALVGAYLRELGFDDALIVYATQAPPTSMQWLTFDDAARLSLGFTRVEEDPTGIPVAVTSSSFGINAAFLYVETQSGAPPSVYNASVRWSEADRAVPDQGVQRELNGLVSIPQIGLEANFDISPNTISDLPATHLFRLHPLSASADSGWQISSIQGISFKATEAERGDPIQGVAGTLPDGFVVATNASSEALTRNLDLLARPWVDIPITLNGSTRAIITLEVAGPARLAFDRAIEDWRQRAWESVQ
jgi:hypothetical protein